MKETGTSNIASILCKFRRLNFDSIDYVEIARMIRKAFYTIKKSISFDLYKFELPTNSCFMDIQCINLYCSNVFD